ncbi:hybrid non-ribosomal peptide synthetase/type I polyketide synthase [Spirosoma aerophilum]
MNSNPILPISNSQTTNLPAGYPTNKSIVDLLVEQANETPDQIAVVYMDQQLTYRELNDQSNQLAHHLQRCGVKEDVLVPVCLHRSVAMIISLVGILKAGGAYVPIDPDYPQDRIAYILADVNSQVIVADALSQTKLKEAPTGATLVCMDNDWPAISLESKEAVPTELTPQNLAYVIYTSGSTGRPKGVMIEHRNVVQLFKMETPLFNFGVQDVWTLFHSFCFDFSVWEIFGALLFGGRLVIVPKATAKDTALLSALLIRQQVTVLNQTPSAFYALQEEIVGNADLLAIRYVIFGGEALNPANVMPWKQASPNCQMINMYGITETTVHVTFQALEKEQLTSASSLIGKPIPTLTTYILNSDQHEVGAGEVGELYVGGAGLARGYLNQPELTASRFIRHPFSNEPDARLYRSGDLAQVLPDGNLVYLGRIDDQVKIRGYRIELGEIEHALQQYPGVKQAVVLAREVIDGDKRLVGYVVMDTDSFVRHELISFLQTRLPDYMVPAQLVPIDAIPLTSNGKVDRKALPVPELSELVSTPYSAPTNPTEEKLNAIWKQVLQLNRVGRQDNFFELGGNSLLAVKTIATLKQVYQYDLPVTKLYQFPTISALAGYLDGQKKQANQPQKKNRSTISETSGDIAVIGMAGRFPGADSVEELWSILKQGRETIRFFSEQELDKTLPTALTTDSAYVKARGILNGADQFDADFFGLNPRLAEVMDPQQRIFMEIAWEVLEKSGYSPQNYAGDIGVWAGCGNNTYYLNNVLRNEQVVSQIGSFQAMTVNEKDFIASRTAYQLNLKGPAVSVFSACSSSLLAITQAVDSIRLQKCELAIAGGASITAPINSGHLYEEGAMLSRDGHCRPFDANAGGTVFSDGAGVVLIKSLAAAKRDGDTIFAVIKGVGVNNDGGGKGSFTAPNAEGQAGAIQMALDDARIDPSTLSYIEAHGTATPLGDPIEIDGLNIAFGPEARKQFCAIGSIKSNLGHLTAAAGVAGFIKTTLALHHRQLPPSLGFETPNPVINFTDSPFFVNTALTEWHSPTPRRAGVSSFGVGGTNVHVVVEEYAHKLPVSADEPDVTRPLQLVTWSAKSTPSLHAFATRLADTLQQKTDLKLADLAFTLQTKRVPFAHRRFIVSATAKEFVDQLQTKTTPLQSLTPNPDNHSPEPPAETVFVFPGQGSQYLNMGRELYENEPVYRQAVDACAELLLDQLDTDIRLVLYPEPTDSSAKERLKNTRYTQPALFVTEYALATLWISWGIQPTLFCGHSIGEFVAAHLAGVFSLADALMLIAARGRLISGLPRGSMLSIRADIADIQKLLPQTLSIAAINSRSQCVVAGADEDIAAISQLLDSQEIPNRVLETSHAFHSAMMDPILHPFKAMVEQVSLQRPRKPIVSTVSGTWLTDAQATDPQYWTNHMRLPVRFADALTTLSDLSSPLLLEVGPGQVTTALARQQMAPRSIDAVASLPSNTSHQSDYRSMLTALGELWMKGLEPDWTAFYGGQYRRVVDLPTYAFNRKRCWVDPLPVASKNQATPPDHHLPVEPTVERHTKTTPMRQHHLRDIINTLLKDTLGIDATTASSGSSFLELGLDSLALTQLSFLFRKEFSLPISFRQLNSEYSTLERLIAYLDASLPADAYQPAVPATQPQPAATASAQQPTTPQPTLLPDTVGVVGDKDAVVQLFAQQLQLMAQQLRMLQGGAPIELPVQPPQTSTLSETAAVARPAVAEKTLPNTTDVKKPFGAGARIERQSATLTSTQKSFLHEFIDRYTTKTAASKAFAQENRRHMADPRVVTGFKPYTKELTYPLVVDKSAGSRLWDIDGNEYIDALNGFGSSMLGYQPDILKKVLHEQIEKGYEIGPQHKLAGEVSRLVCDFTGFDRAALCNTGSEAVMGALRIARTVTGRSLVVVFSGSYHGTFDEVLVRGSAALTSYPAASGIMPGSVQNVLVLDYGTDESLQIIKERAQELAAVLVEPVQSRRPEFQPVSFLKQVRAITEVSGTALIFDEVITGFRMHPGGAQALFGIKADLAAYGKVIGGGLPIGVIAGKAGYMDALDGGFWKYGDASYPEADITFFAGTFVRHPLALAAAKASLHYMKEQGPGLQKGLTAKAARLATQMNDLIDSQEIPLFVAQFGSLWKIKFLEEIPYGELVFTLMRERGIHIWDGFPCFITEAHTEDDISQIVTAFSESLADMAEAGFMTAKKPEVSSTAALQVNLNHPPMPGARLGRDEMGNPAWFIADPDRPGKYLQLVYN